MFLDGYSCGGFSYIVLRLKYDENDDKMYINLHETNWNEKKEINQLKEYFS